VTAIAPSPAPVLQRFERFASVGSTNDVVRGWLAAGEPEICVAVADEQTAGRGRSGRTWTAPAGRGVLLSAGFRPAWLAPDRVWQLAGTVSMAMARASEDVAGLPAGTVRLKWPNDLVVAAADGGVRKLGGVLGETDGLGTSDPQAIVGIGLNADWSEDDFPPDLRPTMTSLRAAAGDRPVDAARLLDGFLERLQAGISALSDGRFAADDWVERQVTTGREVEISMPDGSTRAVAATGVDPDTGALRTADPAAPGGERSIVVGEIVHIRLAARSRADV
jgi:BirA family transcriptional regulator, biotin operon repressor / biotin---[acetyl-CoA-carboxylase] ligase